MRKFSQFLAFAALAIAVVSGVMLLSSSHKAASIRADFAANEESADSAPKQQVVASWAIKDTALLIAEEIPAVGALLFSIALGVASVALGRLADAEVVAEVSSDAPETPELWGSR
ncbi:MAG: hypothetical protein AB2L09_12385 [Coriobacteriia bacterium]